MRRRGNAEAEGVTLDLSGLDDEEKGPQGVKIELKNVWFRYPTRDVPVLNGLNMTVSLNMMICFRLLIICRSRKVNLLLLSDHLVRAFPTSDILKRG
jgi:ABC-type multidrug transport system fused ATPase/permease subunit